MWGKGSGARAAGLVSCQAFCAGSVMFFGHRAAAQTTVVTQINQSSLTIADGTTLQVQASPVPNTNFVGSLTIQGSGVLDLTNQNLLTNTPSSTIRQYLVNGSSGPKGWNGTGGINSSYAATDTTFHRALGFADGADGVVAGLAPGQTLIANALYGDVNLDGRVDNRDFNILAAHFNQRSTAWDQGNFAYGSSHIYSVDVYLMSENYGTRDTTQMSGGFAGAGQNRFNPYNLGPGQVALDIYNGDVQLTAFGVTVMSIDLTSNANNGKGDFIVGNWRPITFPDQNRNTFPYIMASNTAELQQGAVVPAFGYTLFGTYDLGQILPAGMSNQYYINDLADAFDPTLQNIGSSNFGLPDGSTVTFFIPEPFGLGLIGLSAAGLLSRKRRQ